MGRIIYFPVNGIGLGHARRSLRIGRELSRYGKVIFSTYTGTPAYNYLTRSGFRVIGLPKLSWAQSSDGGLDNAKTVLVSPYGAGIAVSHLLIENYLIKRMKPSLVISDMRASPIIIARKHNIPCFMLGLFFDLKREIKNFFVRQPARLLGGFIRELARKCINTFVTDFPPPYTLYERVMPEHIPGNYVFTGPIIDKKLERIIKKTDIKKAKETAKQKLGVTEDYTVLFLPSGVEKSRAFFINGLLGILRFLRKHKNIRFIISLGLIEEKHKIYNLDNVEIWTWIPNLTDYLLASDLIVGYYGMNKVFDSLAAGSFFLGKVASNQVEQLALAKKLREMGIGDIFYSFNKSLVEKIINLLQHESGLKILEKFNEMIKRIDPVKTIIRYIEQILNMYEL